MEQGYNCHVRKGLLISESINIDYILYTVIETCFGMLKSSEHEKL